MNSQAVELMNKNSDKTRSSPSDFSQVMNMKFIVLDLHSFSPDIADVAVVSASCCTIFFDGPFYVIFSFL